MLILMKSLLFPVILSTFAANIRCLMNVVDKYETLCRLLEERAAFADYENICLQSKVTVSDADNYLYERFGMSGNEIISQLSKDLICTCC